MASPWGLCSVINSCLSNYQLFLPDKQLKLPPRQGHSLDLKSDSRTMMRLGYTEAAKVATPSAIFFT